MTEKTGQTQWTIHIEVLLPVGYTAAFLFNSVITCYCVFNAMQEKMG